MYEYLEHINQLFCYPLFIGLPHEMKAMLLQRYHILQLEKRTPKLDFLYVSYCESLMYFHDAILNDNQELSTLWHSMTGKAVKINREINVIRKATNCKDLIPDLNIVSLERVYMIQKELKRPSFKSYFTFSLSGQ